MIGLRFRREKRATNQFTGIRETTGSTRMDLPSDIRLEGAATAQRLAVARIITTSRGLGRW